MNQKKTNNKDKSDIEIVDVDYQIDEATNKKSDTTSKKEQTPTVLSGESSNKELLEELQKLYKKLEEKDEQYDKTHSKYLQALADYENLEKRTKANRANILKQANERLLLKLLDLADSFEKAERSITLKESNDVDSVIEGFRAIRKQFDTILKNEGTEKVKALGEKFDPNFHEVVLAKSDSNSEENTIIEEVQVGYLLNSKLLRPTKVVIAKNVTKGEK